MSLWMLKTYLYKSLSLFFILGFLFIPLTFYGLNWQNSVTRFFYLEPVVFIQDHFFVGALKNVDFSSDTIGLNILLCLLLTTALFVILLLHVFKINSSKLISFGRYLSAYYIALILLRYGFDKVFKHQFYLPEPNILYSGLGSLHKDTLFWSTMGISYCYSLAMGIIEIFAAILILVKRTRLLGFCLATAVLINILIINYSFDISVKTFTTFLLAVVMFYIYPYLKTLYFFFVQHKQVQLPAIQERFGVAKWLGLLPGIGLIAYVLFPYILAGNLNNDKTERPPLHGAYDIQNFIIHTDTLSKCDFPYKRLFVHRNNYIIFQRQDDKMIDYFFSIDPVKKILELHDYEKNKITITYTFNEKTGLLVLKFDNGEHWIVESKSLNWRELPALQDEMHYTIDEIR